MAKSVKYDWEQIKETYINSNRDLYTFSRECNSRDDSPKYSTLKNKCYSENWNSERTEKNRDLIVNDIASTVALTDETHRLYVGKREELLDADKAILHHIGIAQSLRDVFESALPGVKRAIGVIDWQTLAVDDPKTFTGCLRDLTNIVQISTEIERKALSLADYKIDLTTSSDINITQEIKDVSTMSDRDLIAEYIDLLK
jgi:hypothetical protein